MKWDKIDTSDEHYHLERAEFAAAAKGCVVVRPADNELFIDIDDETSMDWFIEMISYMTTARYECRPSPSGKPGRQHVVVILDRNVTALERIALQACLGSDRRHEMLSLMSLNNGVEQPTLFFEKIAS